MTSTISFENFEIPLDIDRSSSPVKETIQSVRRYYLYNQHPGIADPIRLAAQFRSVTGTERPDESTQYQHTGFRIPANLYGSILSIDLNVITNENIELVLNGYRNNERKCSEGSQWLSFQQEEIECGENVLSYTGNPDFLKLKIHTQDTTQKEQEQLDGSPKICSSIDLSALFLYNSIIKSPEESPFTGTGYVLYDYDNECFRLPSWIWSDAPAVSALLKLSKKRDKPYSTHLFNEALGLGDSIAEFQMKNGSGAFLSRYRRASVGQPYNRLAGPNDTSFIIRWVLLPLYEVTENEKYLQQAIDAAEWVVESIQTRSFVPSHYYLNRNKWESSAFVDTGFTPCGIAELGAVTNKKRYKNLARRFMDRFLEQFKLDGGFFGQVYTPDSGVTNRIFTRGQAWVLDGLISTYKATNNNLYIQEARRLADKILKIQFDDGSWPFLIGNKQPQRLRSSLSGKCEKSTAILPYYLIELSQESGYQKYLQSASNALSWCESQISLSDTPGIGGIVSHNLGSGIVGLPFTRVATGYANAYFILAKLREQEVRY